MLVAQQLYEGIDVKGEGTTGLVSYIRTDSVRISDEAYVDANKYILETLSEEYLPKERIEYKSKGRTQDAHEAIRPTSVFRTPESIKDSLNKDQFKLYKLIWERFVASQMAPALYDTVSVKIKAGQYNFRSSGSILKFNGYLAVYKKNEQSKEEEFLMPELKNDQLLKLVEIKDEQHFTQPPARFSEALIIKTLEELNIGRPSTYSPTITTVLSRGYVIKDSKIFYPTELGEIVNDMVANNFQEVVNIDFTSKMEEDLDKVEDGTMQWKEIIRKFYPGFDEKIKEAEEKIGEVQIEDEVTDVICEKCERNMVIKFGKFGKFLACPGFPECRNTKPFFEEAGVDCPLCSGKVFIKKSKKGRKYFGCENNPECEFISWNKPTAELCPECNEYLVEKGYKYKKIVCSNTKCLFQKEVEEETEEE